MLNKEAKLNSLGSLVNLLIISLFSAAPALAVPSLNWVDNGGSATLQIVPSGIGSIEAEIGITLNGVIPAVTLSDSTTFDTPNPGANPFTGTTTTGLYTDELESGEVFASFGSVVLDSTNAIDFLTIDYLSEDGSLCDGIDFSVISAVIAEGGENFSPTVADLQIVASCFGDGDADHDGDVDGDDLIAVQTNFGTVNTSLGDADFDGDVDGDDLIAVQTSFGNTVPSAANASAVPEPMSLVMLSCLALIGFTSCCRE